MPLATLLAACLVPAWAGEDSWPTTITLKYVIHHEENRLPKGYTAALDKAHKALSKRLRDVSPWMDTEKIHIYLYRSHRGYTEGKWHAPDSTLGLAIYPAKPSEPRRLATSQEVEMPVLAHELAHLLFNSFFQETRSRAPRWLDEGLATLAQLDCAAPSGQASIRTRPFQSPVPLSDFMQSMPAYDAPKAAIGEWYAQAASTVQFLKESRSPLHFVRLCKALRDGQDQLEALRQIYGFQGAAAMQLAWEKWRSRPSPALPSAAIKRLEKGLPPGVTFIPDDKLPQIDTKSTEDTEGAVGVQPKGKVPLLR